MNKKLRRLLLDIVFVHDSRFKSRQLRAAGARDPETFNVTRLVEHCVAQVSGCKFVDAAHYDLSDGSEIKTASIRERSYCANSYKGEISGVATAGGQLKQGLLRVIIYNPHCDSLMYYLLPKRFWSRHVTRHPTSGTGKIIFSYNKCQDGIAKFEPYRVGSFEQMCA